MKFCIRNAITNEAIESHGQERYAFRACVILNAHELLNGRVWCYTIDPPVEPIPFEDLNLPEWALNALNKVIASDT